MKEHEELVYLALTDFKIVHWFVHTERLKIEVKFIYIGGSLSLSWTMWNNTRKDHSLFCGIEKSVPRHRFYHFFKPKGLKLWKRTTRYELSFLFFMLWT